MITINYNGETYSCSRAVKGSDFVRLYNDKGICTVAFEGISDFDGYEISGGDWLLE